MKMKMMITIKKKKKKRKGRELLLIALLKKENKGIRNPLLLPLLTVYLEGLFRAKYFVQNAKL